MCEIYVKLFGHLLFGHLEPHNYSFGNLSKLLTTSDLCINSSLLEIAINWQYRKQTYFLLTSALSQAAVHSLTIPPLFSKMASPNISSIVHWTCLLCNPCDLRILSPFLPPLFPPSSFSPQCLWVNICQCNTSVSGKDMQINFNSFA